MNKDLGWKIDQSRRLISDPWISLRADSCTTSTGKAVSPYYVLEYPDWVSVFALDVDNELIVTREYHHGAGITAIGLPGGAVDGKDGDPREGAVRELREETGYRAGEIIELGAVWANWGNHINLVHHFLALGCTAAGAQELDDSEAIAIERIPLQGFRTDHLAQAYHRLNAYMALEKLQAKSRSITGNERL